MFQEIVETVRNNLSRDLLSPQWQGIVSETDDIATGHCCVAAEAVYFLAGGPNAGLRSMVARTDDGLTHWWLEHPETGTIVDPTASQFTSIGETPPYHIGKPCGFMGMRVDPGSPYGFDRKPSKRAKVLLSRLTFHPESPTFNP